MIRETNCGYFYDERPQILISQLNLSFFCLNFFHLICIVALVYVIYLTDAFVLPDLFSASFWQNLDRVFLEAAINPPPLNNTKKSHRSYVIVSFYSEEDLSNFSDWKSQICVGKTPAKVPSRDYSWTSSYVCSFFSPSPARAYQAPRNILAGDSWIADHASIFYAAAKTDSISGGDRQFAVKTFLILTASKKQIRKLRARNVFLSAPRIYYYDRSIILQEAPDNLGIYGQKVFDPATDKCVATRQAASTQYSFRRWPVFYGQNVIAKSFCCTIRGIPHSSHACCYE